MTYYTLITPENRGGIQDLSRREVENMLADMPFERRKRCTLIVQGYCYRQHEQRKAA